MDVLLVEDDGDVRECLFEFLTDCGLLVAEAESAEDGLKLLEGSDPPKVLVTDLDLGPGMGGFILAQTLAERWRYGIPIIFISGRPWLLQSRPLGPRERFLAKPFSPKNLLQVIKELRGLSLLLVIFAILAVHPFHPTAGLGSVRPLVDII